MPFGLSQRFIDSLKSRIQRFFGQGLPDQEDQMLRGPATGVDQIMYRIRLAGRTTTKLHMKYNNTWRHVDPYSFRYRSRGMQPLFYAWCELHDEIHSFRIDRIQDVHNTDRPFAPQYPVEIA